MAENTISIYENGYEKHSIQTTVLGKPKKQEKPTGKLTKHVVEVISQNVSQKIKEEWEKQDIYRLREIMYWASRHRYEDTYVLRKAFPDEYPDPQAVPPKIVKKTPILRHRFFSNEPDGLTIILYHHIDKVEMARYLCEPSINPFTKQPIATDKPSDAFYAYDIRLAMVDSGVNTPQLLLWDGRKEYYRDIAGIPTSFTGKLNTRSLFSFIAFGNAEGIITGYLKGYGYVEFDYKGRDVRPGDLLERVGNVITSPTRPLEAFMESFFPTIKNNPAKLKQFLKDVSNINSMDDYDKLVIKYGKDMDPSEIEFVGYYHGDYIGTPYSMSGILAHVDVSFILVSLGVYHGITGTDELADETRRWVFVSYKYPDLTDLEELKETLKEIYKWSKDKIEVKEKITELKPEGFSPKKIKKYVQELGKEIKAIKIDASKMKKFKSFRPSVDSIGTIDLEIVFPTKTDGKPKFPAEWSERLIENQNETDMHDLYRADGTLVPKRKDEPSFLDKAEEFLDKAYNKAGEMLDDALDSFTPDSNKFK